MASVRHGFFLVIELLLKVCILPKLRARLLSLLGAQIGRNVRIYSCRLINLESGFQNLKVADDVHIGTDCLLDLKGPIVIGRGSTLSPRVMIISHSDPGSAHGSPLAKRYPPAALGVQIGDFCWLGANVSVLSGSRIGSGTVVGAMSLVKGDLSPDIVCGGIPARPLC